MVQRGSGLFEICHKEKILVSGKITEPENLKNEFLKELTPPHGKDTFILGGDDIYKELEFRGFQYKGHFRAIQKAKLCRNGKYFNIIPIKLLLIRDAIQQIPEYINK